MNIKEFPFLRAGEAACGAWSSATGGLCRRGGLNAALQAFRVFESAHVCICVFLFGYLECCASLSGGVCLQINPLLWLLADKCM